MKPEQLYYPRKSHPLRLRPLLGARIYMFERKGKSPYVHRRLNKNLTLSAGLNENLSIYNKPISRRKPKPNPLLWENRIKDTLNRVPKIILLTDDPNHQPVTKRSWVIWRCGVHPYHEHTKPNTEKYISPTDGLPAYRSYACNFTKKKVCCMYGQTERARSQGYNMSLKILKERSIIYNSTYSLVNVLNASEYRGRRYQIHQIHCSVHNTTSFMPIERLQRQVACPCLLCRKEKQGQGLWPDRVKAHYKRHKGSEHALFRRRGLEVWNSSCALTNVRVSGNFDKMIEMHHLNGKESYPRIRTQAQFNSCALLTPIHTIFHYKYLGSFDLSYDPVASKISFAKEANIMTFILFLKQLRRDFIYNSPNTLLSLVNQKVQSCIDIAQQKGALVFEPKPITPDRLDELISLFESDPYQDLFLNQPEAEFFLETLVM